MFKKILYFTWGIGIGITAMAGIAVAAPVAQNFTNIQPFVTDQYDNGTSTLEWLGVWTKNATVSSLTSGDCVQASTGGLLTTTLLPCGSGSGGNSFGQAWEINSGGALAPTTTLGIIVSASSTIGSGAQAGGLTINGGATTTGLIHAAGGSQGAPAYAFGSSVTNGFSTGMYSAATNVLGFSAAGSPMTFDGSNLVIGQWSNGGTQSVSGSSAGAGNSNRAGNNFAINSGKSTGNGIAGATTFNYYPAGISGTSLNPAVEAMRIDTTGNLGIGTTTPFAKLSITGAAGATSNLFAISTSTSAFATTTAFTIDQNGNVSLLNGANFTATGNVTISSLTGTQCLHEVNGLVSSTGSDCGSGGGSSFGEAWALDSTKSFLVPTTTVGIIVSASSTIGSGAQAGGLTISGGATTTGNSLISGKLAVTGNTNVAGAIVGSGLVQAGTQFQWGSGTNIQNPTNGVISLNNNGSTDFTRLDFGGTTASFPALQISTTTQSISVGLANGALGGRFGVGTSTPFARLSIAGAPGGTQALFAISTSTSAATTTTFLIDSNGNETLTGSVTWPYLPSCSGSNALNTDSSGKVFCGAVSGGSGTVTSVTLASPSNSITCGGTNPITTSGTINCDFNLTNPNIWTGLQTFNASPISAVFGNKVGIATSTPFSLFSINPNGITTPAFTIGSSTGIDFQVDPTSTGDPLDVAPTPGAANIWGINSTGQLFDTGTLPTVATSSGAGTGSVPAVVTGNPNDFNFNLVTGTTPSGSNATIATFTMPTSCPTGTVPVFSDANKNTDALAVVSITFASSTGPNSFVFVSGATGLAGATNYIWNFHVGCY